MKLNFQNYKDKVSACWIGKNIGGTMGAPYEGRHEMQDIQGFVTKPGEVLPNDDLDLQLLWLRALENVGPHNITAALLGEYWLSFITPHWNEYGIGKINMRRGLIPPLAGDYENSWKDSNGAWIRTEIWACVTPGTPAAAARYAVEDAKVDHGAGEGTYAAAFVAAMQSAAFVLSDIKECIEIAFASVPENCRVAKTIRFALECYAQKKDFAEARNAIQQMNADLGDGWFEAPSNVAYAVLGMLYGEGDFKKSMILAINCGDDTDCTGATVGATLGILGGMKSIPKDWMEYLGDDIVTISIARGSAARNLPNTCTKLTEQVVRLTASTLLANRSDVELTDACDEIPEDAAERMMKALRTDEKYSAAMKYLKPYSMHFDGVVYDAYVTLQKAPDIAPMGECCVDIAFVNKDFLHENEPFNLSMRWILPEGFAVESGRYAIRNDHRNAHTLTGTNTASFVIRAGETVAPVNRLVLEVVMDGRPTALYIPIILLG